jgi:competence protein ComEC
MGALTLQSRIDAPDHPWLPRARPGGKARSSESEHCITEPTLDLHRPDADAPPVGVPLRASPSSPALTACAAAACVALLLITEAATRWQHSAAYGRQSNRLRVTALDVGQGDATLVDLPDGRLMLIDGGGFVGVPLDPGERVILPTLRARRRDRIDILVLTHPHPDHYGGLASVVSGADIGEFWYGGPDRELAPNSSSSRSRIGNASSGGGSRANPSQYARLLEQLTQRGIPMRSASELCAVAPPGDPAIQLLHPCPAVAPDQPPNDNSLVLRIQHGAHAALFVGDAEHWAEERLLATHPNDLRADFLKVGHHGSRTSSSPDFLQRIQPRYASISSGTRNRFGHPHPETLTHLQKAGALPLRLDRLGAARWVTNGSTQTVTTFLDDMRFPRGESTKPCQAPSQGEHHH